MSKASEVLKRMKEAKKIFDGPHITIGVNTPGSYKTENLPFSDIDKFKNPKKVLGTILKKYPDAQAVDVTVYNTGRTGLNSAPVLFRWANPSNKGGVTGWPSGMSSIMTPAEIKALSTEFTESLNEKMKPIKKADFKDFESGAKSFLEMLQKREKDFIKVTVDDETGEGVIKFNYFGEIPFSTGSENFNMDLGSKGFHIKDSVEGLNNLLDKLLEAEKIIGNWQ